MNNELQLIYSIMNEIGLSVNSFNEVTDQDTFSRLTINGKVLKIDITGNEIQIDKRREVIFNPIMEIKQMQMLFKYYIDKLAQLGELNYTINFAPVLNPVTGKVHVDMTMYKINSHPDTYYKIPIKKDEDINNVSSREYSLHTLGYAELIFKISGKDVDLRQFDIKRDIQ